MYTASCIGYANQVLHFMQTAMYKLPHGMDSCISGVDLAFIYNAPQATDGD